MTVHRVRCDRPYYERVREGSKTFDARLDDRGYREGDTIQLVERNPDTGRLTGRALERIILRTTPHVEAFWPLSQVERHGITVLELGPPDVAEQSGINPHRAAEISETRIARAVEILAERFSLAYTEPEYTPEQKADYLRQVARRILAL